MKKKLQTTTHLGLYSMCGGFLNIFQNVKIEAFFDIFKGLTCGEAFGMFVPFAVGLYAIFHNEDKH